MKSTAAIALSFVHFLLGPSHASTTDDVGHAYSAIESDAALRRAAVVAREETWRAWQAMAEAMDRGN